MNCSQARSGLALLVGQDLDDKGRLDLERHLAVCPCCRHARQQLEQVMSVLQVANAGESPDLSDSLWPDLSERIRVRQRYRRQERFNGWVPALAVTAACLTIVVFASRPQPVSRMVYPAVAPNMEAVAPVSSNMMPLGNSPMDGGMFGMSRPLGWLDRMQTRPVVATPPMQRLMQPEGLLVPTPRSRYAASNRDNNAANGREATQSPSQERNRLLDSIAGW